MQQPYLNVLDFTESIIDDIILAHVCMANTGERDHTVVKAFVVWRLAAIMDQKGMFEVRMQDSLATNCQCCR